MIEGYITQSEVVEWLDITLMSVYRWRKEGMPWYRLGYNILFDPCEVREWVKKYKRFDPGIYQERIGSYRLVRHN